MGMGPQHTVCEERWRGLGLVILKKRRLRGDHVAVYDWLKRGCREDGGRLFFQVL